MYGLTRGTITLLGAAVAGFLIWLASTLELDESGGEYWASVGLLAAAGLTLALSQLLGGWTKWGWPRVSGSVFLIGFLPALVAGGWVLLAAQPADFFNTSNWSRDLELGGLVDDLTRYLGAIAFALGLIFGFTFDTTGPRVGVVRDGETAPPVGAGAIAERHADDDRVEAHSAVRPARDQRNVEIREAGAPLAPTPQPEPEPEPPPRAAPPS